MFNDRCFGWFPVAMLVPLLWTLTWRLDTKLYKFGKFISPNILHMKNCTDLNLGEGLWVYLAPFISYIPGFYLLDRFAFDF